VYIAGFGPFGFPTGVEYRVARISLNAARILILLYDRRNNDVDKNPGKNGFFIDTA